jgi:hypothetical protein
VKKSTGILLIFLTIALGVAIRLTMPDDSRSVPAPPPPALTENLPTIENERSAIGSRENPQARKAYELAMVVDPETGEVPPDIRRREYLYSATIRRRERKSHLREGGTDETAWRSIGPYNVGGRTRALAIDISNENVILAGGVSGGMWRSEDGGNSWTKTTVPSSIHSVSCIVQDTRPGKTDTWYYGTGEFTSNSASKKGAPFRGDGVFKSVDGGKSWFHLQSTSEGIPNNYNSQFQYVSKLIINKQNLAADEVFLATVGALFRSLDGGASWQLVLGTKLTSTPETDLNDADISDYVDISQGIDGSYYCVFSQIARGSSSPNKGVYRSDDGVQWFRITPSIWPRNYSRTVIAPSTQKANEIFFSVNADTEMLWKYTHLQNGNGIWKDLSVNIPSFGGEVGDYDSQDSYNMVLEVHPANSDVIYLGGTNLYRSTDGFESDLNTAWIGGYDTANNVKIFPNHFVDQHALAFYPSDPNKMLSSNDGGIFITENNTSDIPTWLPLNHGFVSTQFYTLALDEFGSKGDIMGGLQDNGTLISNKPIDLSSWITLLSGDGGYSAITRNSTYYFGSFQFGKIYRFTLNSNLQMTGFSRVDPKGSGGEEKLLFVNPYVLAPENQNFMYFAGGDVIWRNFNISQVPLFKNYAVETNWEKMPGTEIEDDIVTALAASYNPGGTVIYGTGHGRLFRIGNANQVSFSVDEITASNFPQNAYVASIAFDRRNSNKIAVSFSNYNIVSLFYSEDGGETFENISGNLEENPDGSGGGPSVRWVEIVSKNDETAAYYVGTSTGVYSTETLSGINTIWAKEGEETIGNVLVTMIKYFSEDGTIVAATHGNGMFESNLNGVWHTEVESEELQLAFKNPFPNPFAHNVNIPFSIPRDGTARASIYSTLGQKIKTLLWTDLFAGENRISWDGTNDSGSRVIRGYYICRLEFEDQTIGTKIYFTP